MTEEEIKIAIKEAKRPGAGVLNTCPKEYRAVKKDGYSRLCCMCNENPKLILVIK